MSTHEALVYPIELLPHENADSLSVVKVEGYTVVVKTDSWNGISKGCFIPPDSIVDVTRPEFSFLSDKAKDGKARIKACKLRGISSFGLLVPTTEEIGTNLWEKLGIEHYEPELHFGMGKVSNRNAPPGYSSLGKYDIENGRGKYSRMFTDGEMVFVQSKLNGSNCSVVYTGDNLYVHSRNQWPEDDNNVFWRAIKATPGIEKFCRDNPDTLIYGECYGHVGKFPYDCKPGEVKFRCFDILQKNRQYVCSEKLEELCNKYEILMAPVLGRVPYDFNVLCDMAELPDTLGNKISEGIVVRPVVERYHERFGRCIIKFINPKYLEKN